MVASRSEPTEGYLASFPQPFNNDYNRFKSEEIHALKSKLELKTY